MRLHKRVEKPTPKVEFPTASEGVTAAQIANASACTQDRFGLSARQGYRHPRQGAIYESVSEISAGFAANPERIAEAR